MALPFAGRDEAGRVLGGILQRRLESLAGVVVLALPRGGVPVAFEVARALAAPLDVLVVRKLGVPGHEELAAGAIGSGGVRVLNPDVAAFLDAATLEAVTRRELLELERREREYRGGSPARDVAGRTAVIVDDGLATGASMRAAIETLRPRNPARVVAAVPVAARETCDELRPLVDDMVCAETPDPFHAVGLWYREFRPVSDTEVRILLARASAEEAERRRAALRP
jgi:putative phosphoribosyl transferase